MEENKKENKSTFQTVKKQNAQPGFLTKSSNHSFTKSVLVPFFSGIVGCSLVLGTCFGVPAIKDKIIGNTSVQTSSNTINNGTVNYVSLSDYSDTAVYAANKILPSIVGINIEYSVNSVFSMFGNQVRVNSYCIRFWNYYK